MKSLGKIAGLDIWRDDDGHLRWVAGAAIDSDGSDNRHHDPCWQAETSLSHNGKPIDAESVPYIVVPPFVIRAVAGIVLGCRARITRADTGMTCEAVVADVGPRRKLGELSCEAARRIGLDGNPNHGGTEHKIVRYEIWPGLPAVVDGISYRLKPS